jgi:DNA invertase Pin-like site-specific DNA recombinase
MNDRRYIAYFRVSTDRQGKSGLGLEAQQQAVHVFLHGREDRIMARFTEIESTRKHDRPQLAAALAACRKHRALLLIAKLDRLARKWHHGHRFCALPDCLVRVDERSGIRN